MTCYCFVVSTSETEILVTIEREKILGTVNSLTLAFWPLVPEFAGSNPAEAVGFFGYPNNPQHASLRRGSEIICSMSQLCGM